MNKPQKEAHKLLSSVGWSRPGDLTIDEIAWSLGAYVKESPLEGSEGHILRKGNTAIITVNERVDYQPKRNFVVAHEIGHFVLHEGVSLLFSETNKTLTEWHQKSAHEQEANQFASELLMPTDLFIKETKGETLSLGLIEEIADYFGTSLTATFLKYAKYGDFPLMIIYTEGGIIRWKQHSDDFPFQWLPLGNSVPPLTVAGDFFNGSGIEDEPVEVDAIEWFHEDYGIKGKEHWKLWEQCFPISPDGLISCLWTN